MDRTPLGQTGEELSIVGFGGILVMNVEPSEAASLVAEAVDRGVNYFDVAPGYGNAEEGLGAAGDDGGARGGDHTNHLHIKSHSQRSRVCCKMQVT